MGTKNQNRKPPTLFLSASLLAIWFSSSVCSTLVNKDLMDKFPYAVTLSAVHMLSAALVDLAIVWYRGLNITFRKDILWSSIPVALTINFGKTLTYVSYGLVPASLTHTAKASSPVFTVIVSKLLFNQVPSLSTFLSLIPITVGVTLSAFTEINWNFLGFLAAVCAALANVLNSTYTKKALHHVNAADPLIFHMYTAVAAVVMLLPYALIVELPTVSWRQPIETGVPTILTSNIDGIPAALQPIHVFPWWSMLLSLLLHYAQNISNIYFLNGVSVLTHQVAQSLKRLLNIAGAVLYFGNHVTLMNGVGMGLALLGFSMYSAAKQAQSTRPRAASSVPTSPTNHQLISVSPIHGGIAMGNGTDGQLQRSQVKALGPAGLLHSPITILDHHPVEKGQPDYSSDSEANGWSLVNGLTSASPDLSDYGPSVSPPQQVFQLQALSPFTLHPTAHALHAAQTHQQQQQLAMNSIATGHGFIPLNTGSHHPSPTNSTGHVAPSPKINRPTPEEENDFCV